MNTANLKVIRIVYSFALRCGLVAVVSLGLSGCQNGGPAGSDAKSAHISPPGAAADSRTWETYLIQASKGDFGPAQVKPYLFLIPATNNNQSENRCQQIRLALTQMAAHDAFPGSAIVIGGPDPTITADVIVAAFLGARPKSLGGLIVLYSGNDANTTRVKAAVETAGASFKFSRM